MLALKPAAVGNGNNPTPYWDGYLKAAGVNPNEVFRDYLALLATTKSQWAKLKVTQDGEEDEQHDNSNDSQQG